MHSFRREELKTKILKTFIFMTILLIMLIILSYIVMPKNNQAEFGMYDVRANGILGEKDNTIDVLVVGDSESFSSIVPMKLWEDYGFTSYVCGTTSQTLPESISFLYKAMQNQKPKIIILDANSIFRQADYDALFQEWLNYIIPVTEYHSRWKNLNINDFSKSIDYSWTDDMKGYDYSVAVDGADSSNYLAYTETENIISITNKLYIKLINEYCKMKNSKLIVVSTPSTMNFNYKNHNAIEKFLKREDIEFLDLNIQSTELNLDWSKDTRDKGDHLNHYGALKVTEYLGNYLSEKNILENHKEDERYKRWNESLERYKKITNV